MTEEDCGLCMFPDLRDKSNDFGVFHWLSLLLIFERSTHSKESINDFLILLALPGRRINSS